MRPVPRMVAREMRWAGRHAQAMRRPMAGAMMRSSAMS